MNNTEYKYYERKINYYETDKMGVVHHSNYARFLEEARIDFMDRVGTPYEYFENNGYMIPVLELKSTFRESVKFGDTIKIVLRISKVSGFRFYFSYEVYDEAMENLKHVAESVHCIVNSEFMPVNIKKELPEIYSKMVRLASEA